MGEMRHQPKEEASEKPYNVCAWTKEYTHNGYVGHKTRCGLRGVEGVQVNPTVKTNKPLCHCHGCGDIILGWNP